MSEIESLEADAIVESIKKILADLCKRHNLDSAQLLCTRVEGETFKGEGSTRCWHVGVGNWYARYGACRAWFDEQYQGDREREKKEDFE